MARESTIGSTFYLQTNPGAAGVAATAATAGAKTKITVSGTYKVGDFVIISGSGSKKLDRMTPRGRSAAGQHHSHHQLVEPTDESGGVVDLTAF